MAVRYKFEIPKGLYTWMEDLQKAGADVDAVADEMLLAGGQVILDEMIRRVPKLTGNLEKHLTISEVKREGNRHWVTIGLDKPDANTARYGNAQEFGTSSMPAQPYLRPAFDEGARKAYGAMKKIAIARGKSA